MDVQAVVPEYSVLVGWPAPAFLAGCVSSSQDSDLLRQHEGIEMGMPRMILALVSALLTARAESAAENLDLGR